MTKTFDNGGIGKEMPVYIPIGLKTERRGQRHIEMTGGKGFCGIAIIKDGAQSLIQLGVSGKFRLVPIREIPTGRLQVIGGDEPYICSKTMPMV